MRISDWSSDVCSSDLRDAAHRVRLWIEENFCMNDIIRRSPVKIGQRQIAKILFRPQHIGALIIDIEKILQVGKAVGGPHFLHRGKRNFHRSEEHTSELQSQMRISYAVFCLKKNKI